MAPPKPFIPKKPKIDLKDLPPINLSPINNPITLSRREKRFAGGSFYSRKREDLETTGDAVRKGSTPPKSQQNNKHHSFAGRTPLKSQHNNKPQSFADAPRQISAKSQLHEVCAAKKWKGPVYKCCKEEGPSHIRLFTFKVVIEMENESRILECFGAPHSRKKEAAEHAAEGALWYLQRAGYIQLNKA